MTRNEARALGLVRYKTGRPCQRGHNSQRYTTGGVCIKCLRSRAGRLGQFRERRSARNAVLARKAKYNGATTYRAAKPCGYGHYTRFVVSNNCVRCEEATRARHKDAVKWRRIAKIYGLTKDAFDERMKAQRGRCAICETKFHDGRWALHIDHDAKTGRVRGLLCGPCNQGIGLLRHDPQLFAKAATYCT